MAKPTIMQPPGFDELSVEEQIEYIQSLWEQVVTEPEKVPVPDWHKKIITERLKAYRENPEEGDSWEKVRDRITEKLGDWNNGK